MVNCTQKAMLGLHKSLFEIEHTVVMSLGFQMKEQLTVITTVRQPFKKNHSIIGLIIRGFDHGHLRFLLQITVSSLCSLETSLIALVTTSYSCLAFMTGDPFTVKGKNKGWHNVDPRLYTWMNTLCLILKIRIIKSGFRYLDIRRTFIVQVAVIYFV